MELEEAQTNSSKKIFDQKAELKYIEDQWAKSACEIKENILAQARVICPSANFSEVGLYCHVLDGRIEDVPIDEDSDADPKSDLINPAIVP